MQDASQPSGKASSVCENGRQWSETHICLGVIEVLVGVVPVRSQKGESQ